MLSVSVLKHLLIPSDKAFDKQLLSESKNEVSKALLAWIQCELISSVWTSSILDSLSCDVILRPELDALRLHLTEIIIITTLIL